ncbi:MAG: hypothetical protein K6A14_06060 [Erysipelotrichaceae bacterium]|nr:hypothetical protein [Erysipelotrichaceae bacterium]
MKKTFIAVQSILYVIIIYSIVSPAVNDVPFKFASIVLCALYAIGLLFGPYGENNALFLLIRLLTMAADYLLVVLDDFYLEAVALFVCVEILYGFLIGHNPARRLVTLAPLVFFNGSSQQLMYVLAAANLANLTFSVLDSIHTRKYLWAIGFALFWCCDFCVGLNNLLPPNNIILLLIWIFYIPSQVILCIGESHYEEK